MQFKAAISENYFWENHKAVHKISDEINGDINSWNWSQIKLSKKNLEYIPITFRLLACFY